MPMSPSVLSADIHAKLLATFEISPGNFNDGNLRKACDAIAQAVVNHITGSAVVSVTSVSGVTTGVGTSGPGTGTIS